MGVAAQRRERPESKSLQYFVPLLCGMFDSRERINAAQWIFLLGNYNSGAVGPRQRPTAPGFAGGMDRPCSGRGAGGAINAPGIAPFAKRDGRRAWRLAG